MSILNLKSSYTKLALEKSEKQIASIDFETALLNGFNNFVPHFIGHICMHWQT